MPILVAYALIIAPLAAAALLSMWGPMERGVRLRLGLVLVVGIVLGLPTLRRAPSDHYWWPLVIGLLPLAALGLDVLFARLRRPGHRALPLAATVLLVILAGLGTWRVQASLEGPVAEAEAYAHEVTAITNREPTPGPLFVWSMASPIYLGSDRPPAGAMLHLYALSLPGYTDASRFEAVCRLFAERRPVIVEEYPDLRLEPGAPTPAGIDASWVEPVRRLVAPGLERDGRIRTHADPRPRGRRAARRGWLPARSVTRRIRSGPGGAATRAGSGGCPNGARRASRTRRRAGRARRPPG